MSFTNQKEKLATKIDTLNNQLDQLRAKTRYKAWSAADVGEKRVDEISARVVAAKRQLEEVTVNTWDEVKDDLLKSWSHLKDDFEQLKKAA